MSEIRYFLLAWDETSEVQAQTVRRFVDQLTCVSTWKTALETRGFAACYSSAGSSPPLVIRADSWSGVVFGMLFKRNIGDDAGDNRPVQALIDSHGARRIFASGGRELVDHYWGNYVAAMYDGAHQTLRVLHGPASSLPCRRMTHNGIRLFFSHIDDCLALDLPSFAPDLEFVAVYLNTLLQTKRTGLRGVSEVLPGEGVEIRGNSTKEFKYWDAIDFACAGNFHDENIARRALKATTQSCVSAWASCHERIMLNLSGGLDSSIVLACLKSAPSKPAVICLNQYSAGANSDERVYARLMVRKAGTCDLIEELRDSRAQLDDMLRATRAPVPQCAYRRVEVARSQARFAHEFGATAIFGGSGGDELFFQETALALADYIHDRGINGQTLSMAYHVAQLEGLSIWAVLRRAIRASRSPANHDVLRELLQTDTLVSTDIIHELSSRDASTAWWNRPQKPAPPGKVTQAMALTLLPDYYDPMGMPSDPDTVHPLLAQPLIELSMRIPAYTLMAGGWERGLARQTFADDLPPEIAWRRGKGDMEDHMLELVLSNLPFVREMLLEGLLLKNDLLDKAKLDAVLAERAPGLLRKHSHLLLHYLNVETWLRTWSTTEPLKIAA
jgi:asparagine synthase (glutamine-hydrolysing)